MQDVVETAIGGKNLTTAIDGRQRLPISVRYARNFRDTSEAIRNVLVTASTGAQIPLKQVASVRVVMGPAMISSENGLLRGSVLLNVRGRDIGTFVEEAQRTVARQTKLPSGYYVEWSGQYDEVCVGPATYIQQKGFSFTKGDQVEVIGNSTERMSLWPVRSRRRSRC